MSGSKKPACVRCGTVGTLDPNAKRGLVRLVESTKHGRTYYRCENRIGCNQRKRNVGTR